MLWAKKKYVKNWVLVLAISILIIDTGRRARLIQVFCIQHLVQFYRINNKNKGKDVMSLIDLCSNDQCNHPIYITKLGFCARKVNVGA